MIAAIPRIMLDLETLSSRPNAAVVSIGAVEFSAEGIGKEFYTVLARGDQVGYGRHIDAGTIDWWVQQSEAARAVFKERPVALDRGLADFSFFCANAARQGTEQAPHQGLEVWGYGSDFDNVVLSGLYEAVGLTRPWAYRGSRCYRTLLNLAKGLVEVPPRSGVHHNALDDAVYQAQCAAIYLKRLGLA